jgi:hypothetical protein
MKKRRLYFEHSFVLTALTIFFVSVRALDDPSGNRRAASQRSLAFRKPRNTRRIMRSNWPRGWLLVYKTPARVFALSFRYCRISRFASTAQVGAADAHRPDALFRLGRCSPLKTP